MTAMLMALPLVGLLLRISDSPISKQSLLLSSFRRLSSVREADVASHLSRLGHGSFCERAL